MKSLVSWLPLMDTGVFYILRNRPSNNSNSKRNLKNAYTVMKMV